MIYGTALQLTEITPPASEPLTVTEAKQHCRVDIPDDDILLGAYIEAARQLIEENTGRAFVDRTYRLDMPLFDTDIILPMPPLLSVTSVEYYDTSNSLQTLATTEYDIDYPAGRIVQAYGGTYPATYSRHDAVQITFTAGVGTTSSPAMTVPERIKAAMRLLVGDMYENREAAVIGLMRTDNPTLDRLIGPSRMRL